MTAADQLSINFTAPYVRGSHTSRAAAKAIEPVAGTQRAAVLAEIRIAGQRGRTDCEIQAMCMLPGDSVGPRRGKLVEDGLIVDSGRTRKTASGRDAVVWVATEYQT